MGLPGIVTTVLGADNAPPAIGRAAWGMDRFALPRARMVGAGVLCAAAGVHWARSAVPPADLIVLAALLVVLAAAQGRLERSFTGATRERFLLASTLLHVVVLTVGLTGAPWFWLAPLLLLLLVADAAVLLGPRGVIAVTVAGAAGNLAAARPWAEVAGVVPLDVGVVTLPLGSVFLSAVVYPALAWLLYHSTRRAAAVQRRLEETASDLRAAQDGLARSQGQLRRRGRELGDEVERQTQALAGRNRYLSILNAVSFALAEPMEDPRALERAMRLVARLVGVRAAQAYTGPAGDAEDEIDLFVTVAPEDIYAPRLPELVLRRVAGTGQPVDSRNPDDDAGVPSGLGEPYHVVPLVARGSVVGALGLIGGAAPADDDRRQLLLLVGREVGVALQGARVYREARERARREMFLTEVAHLMSATGPGDRALPEVLDALLAQVGGREAILVSAPQGSREVVVAGSSEREGSASCLEPLAQSLTALASDREEPLVLGRGGEAPLSERFREQGISTLAVAPIFAVRADAGLAPDSARAWTDDEEAVRRARGAVLSGALIVAAATEQWREESTTLLHRVAGILARGMQSHELLALQQRRIRELSGLAEVARTMQSGADIERLYGGFAIALRQLLSYHHLFIARVDQVGSPMETPVFDARGRALATVDPRASDARHPWFATRGPLLWRSGDGPLPSFVTTGPRSAVVVPMRPKGQMLGIVVVSVPRPLGVDQVRIVEQAVEQLALALDGAMLYQQATERASHIQALSNLARIVASVVNLREAFAAFAEEVRWLIPFDRAVMFLLDDAERQVEPYATYPEESGERGMADLSTSVASVPLEAGGAVVVSRTDPRCQHLDWSVLGDDAAEVAAVPVRQGNRTSAVFVLANNHEGAYSMTELDALDEVAGLLAVTIERLRLYERAEYSAKHDLLTGLPNYRYLQERVRDLHAGIDAPGRSAVLVIDMDNLKAFNDTLGHETGDRVIEIVSRELRRSCRADDFLARTGGDEFMVVMEGSDLRAAHAVADRIHSALLDAHEEIPGAPARIGVSIGVAVAPDAATRPAELMQAADRAMYDAKFAGGQRTRVAGAPSEMREPRALHGRSMHLPESLVRTVTAGATPAEFMAIGRAQRWIGAIMVRLGVQPDLVPQVRMLLAQVAATRLQSPRRDRDQALAHYLIGRIRADLEQNQQAAAGYGVLRRVIPALLDIAWLTMPRPHGEGLDVARAIARYREDHPHAAEDATWATLEDVVRSPLDRRAA